MKRAEALIIVDAMLKIREVLSDYQDGDETHIGIDVSTTLEEENFFMSSLGDLLEIGQAIRIRTYPDETYPYEVYCLLKGTEIHTITDKETLIKHGIQNIPELPERPKWR